jgi:hypothetical protein
LPCFYYDASSMTAAFPARLSALRALMPDAVRPSAVRAWTGDRHNLLPRVPRQRHPAIPRAGHRHRAQRSRRARATRSGRLHAYIQHLPVCTEVALRGGVDFYNFPKFLADIEFQDDRDQRTCRVAEGREHILTLRERRIPATKTATIPQFCHLWIDGQPQTAEFKVHQHEVGTTIRPGAATLELGEHHPIALELDRLIVSRHPLQYEYAPSFEAILYQPEHLTMPLFVSVSRGSSADVSWSAHGSCATSGDRQQGRSPLAAIAFGHRQLVGEAN